MINAAIVGMGWWGKTLVESVQGSSDVIRFVAGASRTASPELTAFAEVAGAETGSKLRSPSVRSESRCRGAGDPTFPAPRQVIAAAAAGKHVFCEKPFALTKADAEAAVKATQKAWCDPGSSDTTAAFIPRCRSSASAFVTGDLGTILHVEATMTFPNALTLKATQWRAQREETPCGGLTPMGVHAIDGMIDLCGPITQVYCQSFRQAVEIDSDDTTSMLFRMKRGMSGYLGTMTATGPGIQFSGFRHKGMGSSRRNDARRGRFVRGAAYAALWRLQISAAQRVLQKCGRPQRLDVTRVTLEAFAKAASGGLEFPIPVSEMIHGASVTEAVVRSAASGKAEKVD